MGETGVVDLEALTTQVRGLVWPKHDSECQAVVFDGPQDLERAYAHCRKFDVAVQAGGNAGVWPKAMSAKFGSVYTFEPDPLNFYCLCRNAPEFNVFKFNAALGHERKCIELLREPHNTGAHAVSPELIGNIPTLAIDDLGLNDCDLIYLDIEGYELAALRGAFRTIRQSRPVIAIEDKGLSVQYGVPQGDAIRYLREAHRYQVVDEVGRDFILAPPQ